MRGSHLPRFVSGVAAAVVTGVFALKPWDVFTQGAEPQMLDTRLVVRPVVTDLVTPTTMAFLGPNEFFVLEKNTGRVQHVVAGSVQGTVLDLAVNSASERGLLGVALHPDFPDNPGVYLFWTCKSLSPPVDPANHFIPDQRECSDVNMFESATNIDTEDLLEVPLFGNRVDRFEWTGSALMFDHRLTDLLAFQNDAAPTPAGQGDEDQPVRGNHDGGVITFGSDGKLYVLLGDVGRRGQLQNLPSGPTETGLGPTVPDDQLGGPEPDDAHFTGVILRLNDDGSTPPDNPFFDVGQEMGGEIGANIQQIFVYGIRNSFGMAVDPRAGHLWFQENGEDAFDELNRAIPGMNSGWIQIAGPLARLAEYKAIETTSLHHEDFPNLQQLRWPPDNIADTAEEALSRLFMLPGARYQDPEFSWKHVLAPAAIGFVNGSGIGSQFNGDLLMGMSVPEPLGGPLFHLNLQGNRRRVAVQDGRLSDRVADNLTFHDMTESESLLIGRDFGVVTDIKTAPGDGGVFVVSLDHGTVYEIRRSRSGSSGGADDET
jgi:glucose/arabinose dehydrogenase